MSSGDYEILRIISVVVGLVSVEMARGIIERQLRVVRSLRYPERRLGQPGLHRATPATVERRAAGHTHGIAWSLCALGLIFAEGAATQGKQVIGYQMMSATQGFTLAALATVSCLAILYFQYRLAEALPRRGHVWTWRGFFANYLGIALFVVTVLAVTEISHISPGTP